MGAEPGWSRAGVGRGESPGPREERGRKHPRLREQRLTVVEGEAR